MMTDDDELLKKRFAELARRADARGCYVCTDFLSLHEQAVLASMRRVLGGVPYTLYGGMEGCERQVAQFGSAEACGFAQSPPIACLVVSPAGPKFAEALTHRDFLGALMHLGVKRDTIGDIMVRDNRAYIFCAQTIQPYILDNLTQVKRTAVRCAAADTLPDEAAPQLTPTTVQASSERLDGVVAKVYGLSREESQLLFRQGRVFRNSTPCEACSVTPHAGEIISVRGYGRFLYQCILNLSRKGKLNLRIEKYQD